MSTVSHEQQLENFHSLVDEIHEKFALRRKAVLSVAFLLTFFAGNACFLVVGPRLFPSLLPPMIEGKSMTEEEVRFVIRHRETMLDLDKRQKSARRDLADRYKTLMEGKASDYPRADVSLVTRSRKPE